VVVKPTPASQRSSQTLPHGKTKTGAKAFAE
jgi:hypothetical protein